MFQCIALYSVNTVYCILYIESDIEDEKKILNYKIQTKI